MTSRPSVLAGTLDSKNLTPNYFVYSVSSEVLLLTLRTQYLSYTDLIKNSHKNFSYMIQGPYNSLLCIGVKISLAQSR